MKHVVLCLALLCAPSILHAQEIGAAGRTGDSSSRAGRRATDKEETKDGIALPQLPVKTGGSDTAALEELNQSLSYSVGWLGGTQVYFLFAYIGTIGDGFGNEVYDEQTASELVMEVVNNTKGTAEMLEKLKPKMNADDAEAIGKMIDIYRDLNTYSTALNAFVKSRSQDDLNTYQTARQKVWPKIQDFLGLNQN